MPFARRLLEGHLCPWLAPGSSLAKHRFGLGAAQPRLGQRDGRMAPKLSIAGAQMNHPEPAGLPAKPLKKGIKNPPREILRRFGCC